MAAEGASVQGQIVRIAATHGPERSTWLDPPDIATAVAALERDGIVVIENLLPVEALLQIRNQMRSDVADLLALPALPLNFVPGHLQQDPPRQDALLFGEVLCNDVVFAISREILGPDALCCVYTGNTNMPDSGTQPLHLDEPHLTEPPSVAATYAVCIDIPLMDVDHVNGATDVWPGTHLINVPCDEYSRVPREAWERAMRDVRFTQVSLRLGGAVLRDARLWHRGMPNQSTEPRFLIGMTHYRSRHATDMIELPAASRSRFEPLGRLRASYHDGLIQHVSQNHAYAVLPVRSGDAPRD
jgi:hypothetical protein